MFNGKYDSGLNYHQNFMNKALQLAELALKEDEIPVGAIITHKNRIIGKGYNQTEKLNDPTAHAEMIAISAAASTLSNKYLKDCTLYVTLEPCPMCAGALVWAKITRIVFGAMDANAGACGSVFNLASNKKLNHQIEIIQGVLEADCSYLLHHFFEKKRNEKNN
ncbi:MAG: tRNA adenosine(34) deaminase TadA [Balneolaceae bacterium]